jgi:hypothetical protein
MARHLHDDAAQVPLSDLDNPIWETDVPGPMFTADGSMGFGHDNHGHPGIMTIHGVRDLLQYVHDEIEKLEEKGEHTVDLPDFLKSVLQPPPSPVLVQAEVAPAKAFHCDTFVLPVTAIGQSGGATLLSARGDRTRIIITNTGANAAYVSWSDDVSNVQTLGQMAWMALPPGTAPVPAGNPREIRAGGKVYAYSVLGTTVDIQEEYGSVLREGGFLSP